jgi:hypothetical protein
MYGQILCLDSARQNRINPNGFLKLFSARTQARIRNLDTKLNSSYIPNAFNPQLVRQSRYPDYFRGTGLQTLFWKLKNFPDLHSMTRVFINKDQSVVFEFEENVTDEMEASLTHLLRSFGHVEFTNPEKNDKRIGYDVSTDIYPHDEEPAFERTDGYPDFGAPYQVEK